MLILISDSFDPGLPAKLSRFGEVTLDKERRGEAEVILVRSKTRCDAAYIDECPELKLIVRGGVGIDNIDSAYARSKGIRVNNTPRASAVAVAELTFALMLAVPNRLIEAHNSMAEGRWIKKELKRSELFGKTLGLVGIGNIATEVGKRAAAFGMEVRAYDKYVKRSDHAEMAGSLDELVSSADYISLHLPLTDETRGMIDASVIGRMKDGAVLLNTGREGCVQAEDISRALADGKLRAYATDVWPSDPPPEDYPLLKAPNVLMTPHIGAGSRENLLRIGNEVESVIDAFIREGAEV